MTANKVAAGISKKTRSEGRFTETARNPEITERWDADLERVRAEVQHKHKDVTRGHECKNMTEYRI